MKRDVLDWIQAKLMTFQPPLRALVEPVLQEARQEFGGDTVYIRQGAQPVSYSVDGRIKVRKVTRRTLQMKRKTEG